MTVEKQLIDPYGRTIDYLRLSITDRCDFRCTYCMAPEMVFLPRDQVLSSSEIEQIARAFTELGIKKIRITGGEPLVRKDALDIIRRLGNLPRLSELAITTNGSKLKQYATELVKNGVSRVNVSLDTLCETRFRNISRIGLLSNTLEGLGSASKAGFKDIKINSVILKGQNDDEVVNLLELALNNEFDISFIEEMPLGDTNAHDRGQAFISSSDLREKIMSQYALEPVSCSTGGPSKYYRVIGHKAFRNSKVGFISPHSENFCGSCNRVRLTCDGRLLLCLGNEDSVSLRDVIRNNPGNIDKLKQTIFEAISAKPEKHHFSLDGKNEGGDVQIVRFMNMTGG